MIENDKFDSFIERLEKSFERCPVSPVAIVAILTARAEKVLQIISRFSESIDVRNREELIGFLEECRTLSQDSRLDAEVIDRLETRSLEIQLSDPQICRAYRIASDLETLEFLSSELTLLEQEQHKRELSPDEMARKARMEAHRCELKQSLRDKTGK